LNSDILDRAQDWITEEGDPLAAIEIIEEMATEIETLRDKLKDANYQLEAAGVTAVRP
jgi:predicted subunit of tRNA(5-methylaminomethyl-2-thiouridylate) methyltransferase